MQLKSTTKGIVPQPVSAAITGISRYIAMVKARSADNESILPGMI
jgi:hypothetical protein